MDHPHVRLLDRERHQGQRIPRRAPRHARRCRRGLHRSGSIERSRPRGEVVPPPPTWSGHDRRAHHGPKEGPRRGDHVRGPRQAPDRAPQDVVLLVGGDPVHRAVVSSNVPRSRPGRRSGRARAPTAFAEPVALAFAEPVALAFAFAEPVALAVAFAEPQPNRPTVGVTWTVRLCRAAVWRRARWRSRGAREMPPARR